MALHITITDPKGMELHTVDPNASSTLRELAASIFEVEVALDGYKHIVGFGFCGVDDITVDFLKVGSTETRWAKFKPDTPEPYLTGVAAVPLVQAVINHFEHSPFGTISAILFIFSDGSCIEAEVSSSANYSHN